MLRTIRIQIGKKYWEKLENNSASQSYPQVGLKVTPNTIELTDSVDISLKCSVRFLNDLSIHIIF